MDPPQPDGLGGKADDDYIESLDDPISTKLKENLKNPNYVPPSPVAMALMVLGLVMGYITKYESGYHMSKREKQVIVYVVTQPAEDREAAPLYVPVTAAICVLRMVYGIDRAWFMPRLNRDNKENPFPEIPHFDRIVEHFHLQNYSEYFRTSFLGTCGFVRR